MIAEFEVEEAIVLDDRSLFALAGAVSQGTARVGMHASLEEEEERFDVRVHGVEFVGGGGEEPTSTRPALTFSYASGEKLDRWQSIDWTGKRLRLYWKR